MNTQLTMQSILEVALKLEEQGLDLSNQLEEIFKFFSNRDFM